MASLEAPAMFNSTDVSAPGHYGPSQTAFLLLDFHSLFIEKIGSSTAQAALDVAVKMRTWAKSQGIQIIHCLIDIDLAPYPTCKDTGRFAGVADVMRASGGNKEPVALLEDGSDDVTFTRRLGFVSALKSPGLDDFLQKKGIKSLILAGLSTSGCVTKTGFAATDAEYVVTTMSDGCADSDESLHDRFWESC
jgi:nicotinamidase-related amidase